MITKYADVHRHLRAVLIKYLERLELSTSDAAVSTQPSFVFFSKASMTSRCSREIKVAAGREDAVHRHVSVGCDFPSSLFIGSSVGGFCRKVGDA